MIETYTSKPFISHDGPDDKGIRAEVRVLTGFGRVSRIEPSKNGNSNQIIFSGFDNNEHDVSGWTNDENLMKIIQKAKEDNEPIHFRIETKRKADIDRTIPIDTLAPKNDMKAAKDHIFKSLSAVKTKDGEWAISKFALTNMLEDPSTGSAPSANDLTPEELKKLSEKNTSNNYSYNSYDVEPAPYITFLKDGSINPGSVSASVAITIYSFLCDYLNKNDVKATEKEKVVITERLLKISNELQLKIWENKEDKLTTPDLSKGSHTRARQLVFNMIELFYPLDESIIKDSNKLDQWLTQISEKAIKMWTWSIKQAENSMKK